MRSLVCLMLTLALLGPGVAQASPSSRQQRKLAAGKAAIDRLRRDERRRRYRDGWEAIERELDGALRIAPRSALAPEVAWWAARARVELYEASRIPTDLRMAIAALRKVDEDYPDAPQGQRALVLAVQIGARVRERKETVGTARRLALRYGTSAEAKAALALLPAKVIAPEVATNPRDAKAIAAARPQRPIEVDSDDSVEPATGRSPEAGRSEVVPSRADADEELNVSREAANVLREIVEDARAGGMRAIVETSPLRAGEQGGPARAAKAASEARPADPATAESGGAPPSGEAASAASGPEAERRAGPSPSGAGARAQGNGPRSPAVAESRAGSPSREERKAAPLAARRSRGESHASEEASESADDGAPPEPEAPEAPPQRTPAILKLARDAVAKLTEPEDEPDAAARARELRSSALANGSLAAQLGLKVRRVVIDPGHGGKDTGAIGPHGVREKDVALSIAKRLASRLRALNFAVTLTRKGDTFVPLDERTRIANEAKADLFVSIHCNAARRRTLSGIETWTLNVASDRYAARLAAFENADDERTVSDLRLILADLATKANATDARELAQSVQSSLVRNLRSRIGQVKDHGTKQALFYVLLGTHMPSILVETAFLSNPAEEARLRSSRYQDGAADAIARGVKDFVDSRQRLALAP